MSWLQLLSVAGIMATFLGAGIAVAAYFNGKHIKEGNKRLEKILDKMDERSRETQLMIQKMDEGLRETQRMIQKMDEGLRETQRMVLRLAEIQKEIGVQVKEIHEKVVR